MFLVVCCFLWLVIYSFIVFVCMFDALVATVLCIVNCTILLYVLLVGQFAIVVTGRRDVALRAMILRPSLCELSWVITRNIKSS